MAYRTIIGGGGNKRRRYRQGCGSRWLPRIRRGRGPKMEKFKSFMRKSVAFSKKHVLSQLKELGMNVLMDAMEGKIVGNSLKSNFLQQFCNYVRNQ